MKRRIARNALGRVVLSSTLGLVVFVGCGPSLDPLVVAGQLAAASRQTFTRELASTADRAELSAASQGYLDAVNAALDGVHNVPSALEARSSLTIVADRMFGISRAQALLDEAPSESARKSAAQRLESIGAWTRYQANLKRIEAHPELAVQLSEPLAEMVIFFERQNGAI